MTTNSEAQYMLKPVEEQVIIPFEAKKDDWTYMDTLVFSREEYDSMTQEQINDIIEKKFTDWLAYVKTPIQ